MYLRKGGDHADTLRRACLCNALTASIGLGQTRANGYDEPPLVTIGFDLTGIRDIAAHFPNGWTGADVIKMADGTSVPAV